ncbi:hypothetical protein [Lactobacillus backii] [Lactiplantibacillus mudanjiangensis]|uniref:glycosyltransferase n=1 Tax=Lactiplantibacillus mudanjiangensis TaxID=1296538 RepID=UPI001014474E|nr:hypothetical protein [Lactobacillus backii] [Lactiplantibacillus mudanjiangensis]
MENIRYASVIVTYNRKKLLKEAVISLLNQDLKPENILIVDNASTDGTEIELEQTVENNKCISYYRLKENMGGAYGFWFGLNEASKLDVDWVSLSDDDAIYNNNYFSRISKSIEKNSNVLAFTGTVRLMDESIQKSHRRRVDSWSTLRQSEVEENEYKKDFYFDIFTFVGAVISLKLIKRIGLPRKDYFIWYDDTEYSLRVRKYTKIMNVSHAEVIHKTKLPGSATTNANPTDWKQYYGVRNQMITVKKHARNPLLACAYVVYRTIRRMAGTLIKRERRGYRKYMLQQDFTGLVDGLRSKVGINKKYTPK